MNGERHVHHRALELAAMSIDFGLGAAEREELQRHLAACPSCERAAAHLHGDAVVLAQSPARLPSRRVDDAVLAAIAGQPARPQRILLLVAAAALLLVALLGVAAAGSFIMLNWPKPPAVVVPTPPVAIVDESPGPSAVPIVDVKPTIAFSSFDQPANLASLVLGSDGAPYVLDRATAGVYRIDLVAKRAVSIFSAGQEAGGATTSVPRLLTMGGSDVLILDAESVLWRWRPADANGTGTLTPVRVREASWGTDIVGIGTFLRNPELALYNLYVVNPSESQIVRYVPAVDGSGFPASGTDYLATPRDVAKATSLYIDGELFLADGGALIRFHAGADTDGWPIDGPTAHVRDYRLVASPDERGQGILYAYDAANQEVVAIGKTSGSVLTEYRVQSNVTVDWRDVRGLYVTVRASDNARQLWWIDAGRLLSADLGSTPMPPPSTGPAATRSPAPTPTPSSVATGCVSLNFDYGLDARGKAGDPVSLARNAVAGLRADDVVERGDPARAGAVRIVRAGEIVGDVTYASDGHGGWLLVGGTLCAGLGVKS